MICEDCKEHSKEPDFNNSHLSCGFVEGKGYKRTNCKCNCNKVFLINAHKVRELK